MSRTRTRIARTVAAVVALAVAAAGCQGPPGIVIVGPDTLAAAVITRYNDSVTRIAGDTRHLSVTHVSGDSGNERGVWVYVDSPFTVDQTTCATWTASPGATVQPGLMVRWDGPSGRDPITLTRNVWGGPAAWTAMNVNTWRMANPDQDARHELLDSRHLPGLTAPGGGPLPFPWRACLRVAGDQLSYLVWPVHGFTPAWGDPAHGATITLPQRLVHAGRVGGYEGHITAGGGLTVTDQESSYP